MWILKNKIVCLCKRVIVSYIACMKNCCCCCVSFFLVVNIYFGYMRPIVCWLSFYICCILSVIWDCILYILISSCIYLMLLWLVCFLWCFQKKHVNFELYLWCFFDLCYSNALFDGVIVIAWLIDSSCLPYVTYD